LLPMVIDELESAKPKNEHEVGRLQLLINEAFSLTQSNRIKLNHRKPNI
jgi:hypothetical protein